MRMKYLQGIADIQNHLTDVLSEMERGNELLLETWNIRLEDKEDITEEWYVLEYLISCDRGFAGEERSVKPSLEVVERCFHRHLDFLEDIHGCHKFNVNKHSSKITRKAYKTCRHYLFKFSLPAWYRDLPDVVPTIEEKEY